MTKIAKSFLPIHDTLLAINSWIITNPNGSNFKSLEDCFLPLLECITKSSSWAVTGVKSGESKVFISSLNKQLIKDDNNASKLSELISILGNRKKIVTTTDLCLHLHKENTKLFIWACEEQYQDFSDKVWDVCVLELVREINNNKEELRKIVEPLLNGGDINRSEADIKRAIRNFPEPKIFPSKGVDFDNTLEDQLKSYKFKIYILLLTLLNPSWSRISMLPSINPAGHYHHPGGIVLCEDFDKNRFTNEQIQQIQQHASLPFWPWMLTARTSDRGAVAYMEKPSVSEALSATSNDFRRIEYIFGGKEYTLTDGRHYKTSQKGDDEKNKTLLNRHRFLGLGDLFSGLNDFLTNRYSDGFPQFSFNADSKGKVIFSGDKEQKRIVLERLNDFFVQKQSSTEQSKTLNTAFDDRHYEKNRRINAITEAYNDNKCKTISIVVPIASDHERVENFLVCLESYNSQIAIQSYPKLFELVILIDTGAGTKNIDIARKQAELIKLKIEDLGTLNKIKVKIFVSEDFVNPIGRSSIRNYGAMEAFGDVVQFFDDSILLHKEYLLEVLIRFEFLVGQDFMLVGFKERLGFDQIDNADFIRTIASACLMNDVLLPDCRDDFRRKDYASKSFSHAFENYTTGEPFDAMHLTGDLCFLNGNVELSYRKLNHFFSTALVAVWKSELKAAGGFHGDFDPSWGYEDGHLGMVLIGRGNKLIPCYSALSLDLHHAKPEKDGIRSGKDDSDNKIVLNKLMKESLTYYDENLFKSSTEKTEKKFELFYKSKFYPIKEVTHNIN